MVFFLYVINYVIVSDFWFLCSVVFYSMTVREHMEFYCAIKSGFSKSKRKQEIDRWDQSGWINGSILIEMYSIYFRILVFFKLYIVGCRPIFTFPYLPGFQFAPRCGPVARPGCGGFLIVRGDAAPPLCGPGLCWRFQSGNLGRTNQWGRPQRTQKYLEPPCQTQNEWV